MTSKKSPEAHVAVLVFPFASHPGLFYNLVKILAEAAPNVTFTLFSTPKTNQALLKNAPPPSNIIQCDIYDGVPDGYVFAGRPFEEVNLFLAVASDELRRGVEKVAVDSGKKFTCIVADAFLWFTCDLAREIGVPWVPFWTAGACSLSAHIYTHLIRQTIAAQGFDESCRNEKLNFIPGFTDLRLGDLPGGVAFGNFDIPFLTMLQKMGQTLPKAADALLMNSFDELDPDLMKDLKPKFNKIFNVGPFNLITSPPQSLLLSDQYKCIQWLDQKQHPKSVAYISFGTMANLPPEEVAALAEALETSATPFLWSMKDDLKKHLPLGFLERTSEVGKVVAWAPQVEVLSHAAVGVFITHCGWGSVLESIAAAVPLICRPFYGDQIINAWMIENVYKIGVRINDSGVFTKNGAVDALEQVLDQEKGKKLREQITRLKDLAYKAVGPDDGSSTQNFKGLLEMIST